MAPQNLLFIISDEHSRRYNGCYGDPIAKTPFIDGLAAEGTRFSRAYSPSPTCVSARACLATGTYVHENENFSSIEAYDGTRRTWAHNLREAGHEVVSFGKLGFRTAEQDNGFTREYLPIHNQNGMGWVRSLLRNPLDIPEKNAETLGFADHIGVGETDYTKYDRVVTDTACAWMRKQTTQPEKTWAMFVSLISPHYPLICPREFYDLYEGVEMPKPYNQDEIMKHPVLQEYAKYYNYNEYIDAELTDKARRAYYGLVSFTDYLVGNLLTTLEDCGLSDDTRIVYTSDHGEMLGNHGIWTKMVMYEDSVAIPMIVKGKGVPKAAVNETPVSLVDMYKTAVLSCGSSLSDAEKDLPGTDLIELAQGESRDRYVLSEYHDGGSSTGMFMVVSQRWKLVAYPGHPPQLFDLQNDPNEDHDLADNPDYAAQLEEAQTAMQSFLDPETVNDRAMSKQGEIVAQMGGAEKIVARDDADIFIELDALYENCEQLRTPAALLAAHPGKRYTKSKDVVTGTGFPNTAIRNLFPSLKITDSGQRRIYFDNPAGTQVSGGVIEAVSDYYLTYNSNSGVFNATSQALDKMLEELQPKLGQFFGTDDADEVLVGSSMTALTFQMMHALKPRIKAGAEIIVSRADHEGNVSAWLHLAEDTGATVRWLDPDPDTFRLNPDKLKTLVTDKTFLVALNYASNLSGAINDIEALVAVAKEAGALTYVDAVQFAPHGLIDVQKLGCDFLACSPYKFFGPHLGLLWGRRDLLEEVKAYKVRCGTDELPYKFSMGTPPYELMAGLSATLDYLGSVGELVGGSGDLRSKLAAGFKHSEIYEDGLSGRLLEGLGTMNSVTLHGPGPNAPRAGRVPTFSFTHETLNPSEIAKALSERGIYCHWGHNYAFELTQHLGLDIDEGVVRVGLAHYNTMAEVDTFLEALAEITRKAT